ncbi:MAG TPA: metalloregulator ArsR/SmtB family transcription factor [Verrucomicrobiales bacterium]|nr:winged helix-turn-helix transcriptional regulator [Verrucomicrobiae bacterium]MCP5554688.1 winged helix-turn-helix transcriptional regulator [Akkermansiaceae bacterium]HRX56708.1 metalloregulator ArsR/SmtB family transcription factor [Verrucomicrobiales bacterium]
METLSENCVAVYKCLCDLGRLRILNLLRQGPLCGCHLQVALEEPQPKVSKQLAYMKRHGLLVSTRRTNWTIFRLAEGMNPLLEENLKCLQDLAFQDPVFQQDLARLAGINTDPADCCD